MGDIARKEPLVIQKLGGGRYGHEQRIAITQIIANVLLLFHQKQLRIW